MCKNLQIELCAHFMFNYLLMNQKLKRNIESHLAQLNDLCKIYRGLARSGRNDTAGELRQKIDDACKRWELVSKCVREATKRIDRAQTVSVDLDDSMESLAMWLNDVAMRLNRLQYLCKSHSI